MNSIKISQEIPKCGEYDVIVAGSGPAGVCAAVAAAREGAKVALIERYGVLGGNLTAGYVGPILGSVAPGTMKDELCELLGVKDNDWIGEQGKAHDFEAAKLVLAEFVAAEENYTFQSGKSRNRRSSEAFRICTAILHFPFSIIHSKL